MKFVFGELWRTSKRERPFFSREAENEVQMKPVRWLTRINMGIKVVDGESPVCFQKLAPKLKVLIAGFKLLLILMYQVLGWVEIGVLKSTDAFRSFTAFLEKSCSNGNNISLNLRCHWLWDISIPIPYVFQRKINGCKWTYNTMFLINSNFYCMLLKELWMTYLYSFLKKYSYITLLHTLKGKVFLKLLYIQSSDLLNHF